MPGAIVLDGGNTLSPESNALYKGLLQELSRLTGQADTYLVVIPVAAVDNPRKAARGAVAFFKALGFRAEQVMIADRVTANDPSVSAPLEHTNVAYLTDANPLYAADTLKDTEALVK